MHRDVIDSLMAGGLLSFLPIWEIDSGDQAVIAMGLAVLAYIVILLFRKEGDHGEYNTNNHPDPARH